MYLKDLQDKHKGEIIFIIGGGVSVNNIDINLLKGHTTIAVNSGIVAVPFAQYMCSDDEGILNWSYFYDLKKMNCICLFYEKKLKKAMNYLYKDRIIFYNHKSWFSPPNIYNLPNGLLLTKNIKSPIIGSRISTGSAVHLAYCMGAKVIVLIGNDCCMRDGKRYFWQDKKNHPYRVKGTIFNKSTQNIGFDQRAFVEYWNKFSEINKDIIGKEVNIIDCSESVLDCFPKMEIEEVIEKYD